MFVKPAKPNVLLRDPRTRRVVPPEGAQVSRSSYWIRRILDGDAIEVKPEEAKPKRKRKAKTVEAQPDLIPDTTDDKKDE